MFMKLVAVFYVDNLYPPQHLTAVELQPPQGCRYKTLQPSACSSETARRSHVFRLYNQTNVKENISDSARTSFEY
jgi:hypothetical protein